MKDMLHRLVSVAEHGEVHASCLVTSNLSNLIQNDMKTVQAGTMPLHQKDTHKDPVKLTLK